ncbi:DUF2256 domain-containing protein [Acinetobacter johnsonii]
MFAPFYLAQERHRCWEEVQYCSERCKRESRR